MKGVGAADKAATQQVRDDGSHYKSCRVNCPVHRTRQVARNQRRGSSRLTKGTLFMKGTINCWSKIYGLAPGIFCRFPLHHPYVIITQSTRPIRGKEELEAVIGDEGLTIKIRAVYLGSGRYLSLGITTAIPGFIFFYCHKLLT